MGIHNVTITRPIFWAAFLVTALFVVQPAIAQEAVFKGRVVDPQGRALPGALIEVTARDTAGNKVWAGKAVSAADGVFALKVPGPGRFDLRVEAAGFRAVEKSVAVGQSGNGPTPVEIRLTEVAPASQFVNVTADVTEVDILLPDPAVKVFVSEDLLDANPGRPGAPVSIPGYPIETASSGIKAPQYFAPGVAGDHGEAIAQYIAVGSYLVPNNLSANAHGNGYADPNIYIPEIFESVLVDGGAYNVREGNHSVDLAATYSLRSHLDPFLTITGDHRDVAVTAGASPSPDSFVAVSAALGNGFLDRLEHRQQYKINGQRIFHFGDHQLTLFGIGYYGFSYMAGLVPILGINSADYSQGYRNYGDTIDPRQKDRTHTALAALSDQWKLTENQQLQLGGSSALTTSRYLPTLDWN